MSKEAMKLALGKIKSARDCHFAAIDTLLFEAEEILEEALAEQPAQQALDKMAENARELGLDYEPAQQEPVAGLLVGQDSDGRYVSIAAKAHADTLPLGEYKLYTSPPAQRTWVGLTDEEIEDVWQGLKAKYIEEVDSSYWGCCDFEFARAIEAAHGIKENT